MGNALLQKISKAESMYEELKDLDARRKALNAELDDMEDNCKHEVVVVSRLISAGYSLKAKCLCCGKMYSTPHTLREEVPYDNLLEVYSSKKIAYTTPSGYCFGFMTPDEIYDAVKDKIHELISASPNMTSEDIIKELREFFK